MSRLVAPRCPTCEQPLRRVYIRMAGETKNGYVPIGWACPLNHAMTENVALDATFEHPENEPAGMRAPRIPLHQVHFGHGPVDPADYTYSYAADTFPLPGQPDPAGVAAKSGAEDDQQEPSAREKKVWV